MEFSNNSGIGYQFNTVKLHSLTAQTATNNYNQTKLSPNQIYIPLKQTTEQEFASDFLPKLQAIVYSDKSFFKVMGEVAHLFKESVTTKENKREQHFETEFSFSG